MYQRHICPSMGALRRSLIFDVAARANCSSRSFHASARRFEEQPKSSPSTPAPSKPQNDRKARTVTAMRQINSLQNRRPPPNSQPAQQKTPQGTMVRAPSKLRIARPTTAGGARGGARGGPRGGPNRGPGGPRKSSQNKPLRRDKKANAQLKETPENVRIEDTLSNGMVQQLLRIQRKEWDRVPYEPKYVQGSFAANELIHAGRELFRGESAPMKYWGPLEKKIGVVGMYGAEALVKIRRVPDGDAAPFGKEDELELAKEKSAQK